MASNPNQQTSADLPTHRPTPYSILCNVYVGPYKCRPADLPTCRLHLLGKMAIELLWIIFLFKCQPADLPTILFRFYVYERAYISKWPLSYYEIYIFIYLSADLPTCRPNNSELLYYSYEHYVRYVYILMRSK